MHLTSARLAATTVIAVATTLLAPAHASAHTVLAGSIPAAGATIEAGTTEVVLSFSAPVREELSTVLVTGADGADHARGSARVRGDDVVQPVAAPLPPGAGTVSYRVVAADGHPITGTVEFVVATGPADPAPAGAGALAPTEGARVAASDEGAGAVLTAGVVGAAFLGAGVIGVLLRARRRRG